MKEMTIKDIAHEAGVSIATVSNVLNQKKNKVSKKKRLEIEKIIEKYNYVPNLNARSLVGKESKMIGVLYYSTKSEIDYSDPYISNLITGVEAKARSLGIFALFHGFNQLDEIDVIQKNWNYDGFIIVGAIEHITLELIKKISKPMVFVDSYCNESIEHENIIFVNNNDRQLSYEATHFLINKGHEKISFFTPSFILEDNGVVPQRYLGYLDALNEKKITVDEEIIFSEDDLDYFIDSEIKYSATIINSDYLAAQYLQKVREKNKQPKSLISFDNNMYSKLLLPALSTVELHQKKKGRISVQAINDILQNVEKAVQNKIIVEGKLIHRESVMERG